jgi:hypothetical protein
VHLAMIDRCSIKRRICSVIHLWSRRRAATRACWRQCDLHILICL